MQPTKPTQPIPSKPKSSRPSIAGGILSVIAMISSGIAYGLRNSDSRSTTEVTTPVGVVNDGPVADAASGAITGILSFPFIIIAILFGSLALLFTLLRLRKVKAVGIIFSIIWIILSVLAIYIAIGVFDGMRADPA